MEMAREDQHAFLRATVQQQLAHRDAIVHWPRLACLQLHKMHTISYRSSLYSCIIYTFGRADARYLHYSHIIMSIQIALPLYIAHISLYFKMAQALAKPLGSGRR